MSLFQIFWQNVIDLSHHAASQNTGQHSSPLQLCKAIQWEIPQMCSVLSVKLIFIHANSPGSQHSLKKLLQSAAKPLKCPCPRGIDLSTKVCLTPLKLPAKCPLSASKHWTFFPLTCYFTDQTISKAESHKQKLHLVVCPKHVWVSLSHKLCCFLCCFVSSFFFISHLCSLTFRSVPSARNWSGWINTGEIWFCAISVSIQYFKSPVLWWPTI